jgi:hypothetical protein
VKRLWIVIVAALGLASPASAVARHCGRVYVPTRGVRVVHGPVSCRRARSLIKATYHAEDSRHWGGHGSELGIYWRVQRWRCYTGLGWSESFCFRGGREVDGSTRRNDGWHF